MHGEWETAFVHAVGSSCGAAAVPHSNHCLKGRAGASESTSKQILPSSDRCVGWCKERNLSSRCEENLRHSQLITNLWVSKRVTDKNGSSVSAVAGIVVDVAYLLACKQLGSLFSSRRISLPELF